MYIVEVLDSQVSGIAQMIGKPDDQIRLMLCLYIGYPLGWFMNAFVRGRMPRHLYATILGFLLQLYMFRGQFYHVLIMTFVSYALMNFFPRHQQQRYVMGFVLIYLSAQHIIRMVTNFGGYDMDISTYTMIHVAKLSALAFCYSDGGKDDKVLLPDQRIRKVVNMPSVLELLSYTYFCSGCIMGPFFEYSDYIRFIEEKEEYKEVPNTILLSLRSFFFGKLCLAAHLVLIPHFNVLNLANDDYIQRDFLYKVFYYYIAMSNQRLLYYTPWNILDGLMHASGISYSGKNEKTKKHEFEKFLTGKYVLEVEFATSPAYMFTQWNKQIHLWLKFYVFNRSIEEGKKPGLYQNMLTFIVSGFWHGFYPFYYIMFFFCALFGELAKDIYRSKILFEPIPSIVRSLLGNFFSMLCMNYFGCIFMLLTFEKGFRFTNSIYNFVYIIVFSGFVFFRFSGIVRYAQKLEAKRKAKQEPKRKVTEEEEALKRQVTQEELSLNERVKVEKDIQNVDDRIKREKIE